MATKEVSGPSGEILIRDYFWESPSGHVDVSETQKLIVSGDKILFKDYERRFEQFKRTTIEDNTYEISIETLLELIKEKGKKVKS